MLRVYAYSSREEPLEHVKKHLDRGTTAGRARYERDGRTTPPSSGLERG